MPPQNPYPKHQAGYWLDHRRLRIRRIENLGGDFKIKQGKIILILDGEEMEASLN